LDLNAEGPFRTSPEGGFLLEDHSSDSNPSLGSEQEIEFDLASISAESGLRLDQESTSLIEVLS
jgi:hypothetical protein